MTTPSPTNHMGLPERDEAIILDGVDGSMFVGFNISRELLARIETVAGVEPFKCEFHQAMVLVHLLELGTSTKEAQLEVEAGQESLF